MALRWGARAAQHAAQRAATAPVGSSAGRAASGAHGALAAEPAGPVGQDGGRADGAKSRTAFPSEYHATVRRRFLASRQLSGKPGPAHEPPADMPVSAQPPEGGGGHMGGSPGAALGPPEALGGNLILDMDDDSDDDSREPVVLQAYPVEDESRPRG